MESSTRYIKVQWVCLYSLGPPFLPLLILFCRQLHSLHPFAIRHGRFHPTDTIQERIFVSRKKRKYLAIGEEGTGYSKVPSVPFKKKIFLKFPTVTAVWAQ
jgi:hypothetical protein